MRSQTHFALARYGNGFFSIYNSIWFSRDFLTKINQKVDSQH